MQKTRHHHHNLLAVFLKQGFAVHLLLLFIFLTSGLLIHLPKPVIAGNFSPANEAVQTNPTPTPTFSNPDQTARTSPLVGILVLLAPLVFIVWKSRGMKEPKVTASCCAPVIDENKRPFRIEDD